MTDSTHQTVLDAAALHVVNNIRGFSGCGHFPQPEITIRKFKDGAWGSYSKGSWKKTGTPTIYVNIEGLSFERDSAHPDKSKETRYMIDEIQTTIGHGYAHALIEMSKHLKHGRKPLDIPDISSVFKDDNAFAQDFGDFVATYSSINESFLDSYIRLFGRELDFKNGNLDERQFKTLQTGDIYDDNPVTRRHRFISFKHPTTEQAARALLDPYHGVRTWFMKHHDNLVVSLETIRQIEEKHHSDNDQEYEEHLLFSALKARSQAHSLKSNVKSMTMVNKNSI